MEDKGKYGMKRRYHCLTRLADCWLARVMRGWCRGTVFTLVHGANF
jgi:hypothetical protein